MQVTVRCVATAVILGLFAGCGDRPPAADEAAPGPAVTAAPAPIVAPATLETTTFEREVKTVTSRRLSGTPAIDGVVGPEWADAEMQTGFFLSGVEASRKSSFMVGHDDANLYIIGIFEDAIPGRMRLQAEERDSSAVWQDCCVELFISPGKSKETYYQLVVSATGVQYDGLVRDREWDGEWRAAAKVGEDKWVAEVAIPFSTLGVDAPKPGEEWGFNVARNDNISGENSQWSDTWANNHWPEFFGVLIFGE